MVDFYHGLVMVDFFHGLVMVDLFHDNGLMVAMASGTSHQVLFDVILTTEAVTFFCGEILSMPSMCFLDQEPSTCRHHAFPKEKK